MSLRSRLDTARSELTNPLIYPFFMVTLAYGVGFTVFHGTHAVQASSLFHAMVGISPFLTHIWGGLALFVIVAGFLVLCFNRPRWGKANCLLGWLLWLFASIIYCLVGGWLTLFSVALPSLFFWTWEYFSLHRYTLDSEETLGYDEHT